MADKKVGLGRGIGALIPSAAPTSSSTSGSSAANDRPIDVFFGAGSGTGGSEANLSLIHISEPTRPY